MDDYDISLKIRQYEYSAAFLKGYNYVLYEREDELEDEPEVDYSDFNSIGYYDGYCYGDFCYRTGKKNAINSDIEANIDKCYSQAIKRNAEYLEEERKKK